MWLLLALGCSNFRCDLEAEAIDVVGRDAEDCGSNNPLPCIEQAVLDGRAAWGTTRTTGIDSVITTAYSWTGERLWLLSEDSMSSEIDGRECVGPSFPDGQLDCERYEPSGNHYLVCGGYAGGSLEPLPFNPTQ